MSRRPCSDKKCFRDGCLGRNHDRPGTDDQPGQGGLLPKCSRRGPYRSNVHGRKENIQRVKSGVGLSRSLRNSREYLNPGLVGNKDSAGKKKKQQRTNGPRTKTKDPVGTGGVEISQPEKPKSTAKGVSNRQPVAGGRDEESRKDRNVTCTGTNELSWEKIREEQSKDLVIAKVIELLPTAEMRDNVNEFGPEVAHLWAQRKSLTIIDDVLHRNFETTDGSVEFQQVLVPLVLVPTFLYWVHSDPSFGHMGIQKTTEKLKRYAYWTGWRRDVELFVKRCETCCRYRKGPAKPQGTMRDTAGSYIRSRNFTST